MMGKETPHIGEAIKQKVEEIGMSVIEFADAICCTERNVYHIFKRKSIHTKQLFKISKVLKFDFSIKVNKTGIFSKKHLIIVCANEEELKVILSKFQVFGIHSSENFIHFFS